MLRYSLLHRATNVRYITLLTEVSASTKSNGSIRQRTSARCMSISRTSLSFSPTSIDFLALAKFDSLKLTETHFLFYLFFIFYHKIQVILKKQGDHTKANTSGEEAQKETMGLIDIGLPQSKK